MEAAILAAFQSLVGTLKTTILDPSNHPACAFQSLVGTLKTNFRSLVLKAL